MHAIVYNFRMRRDDALKLLKAHEPEFKRLGVEHLYVFGSTARDEADDSSDVDIFLDHQRARFGLYELLEVQERAAAILGQIADVITRGSLHPALKKRIEDAAIRVF